MKKRKGNKFYSPDNRNSFISQADHEPNAICPVWKMENPKSISTLKHARKYAATTTITTAVAAGVAQLNLTSMLAMQCKMQWKIAVVAVVVAII